MLTRLPLLILLLSLSSMGIGTAQTSRSVVIRCGRLIDARSDQPLLNATIVIQDERITAVGQKLPVPAGAQVIDLGQATVLPGLMDLHAHILYDPKLGIGPNYLNRSSARKAFDGLLTAQKMLRAGFTTLRDPGDFDAYYALVEIRDAIARGDFVGPRLLVAAHAITATGGHADLNDIAPDLTALAFGKVVNSPDEMRRAVREEIKYGCDWIKLMASGGVMSMKDDPRVQGFTDEEFRAAVEETHRYGKKITVHAIGAGAIKSAVRAGVDSVEHGILIDDEGIALMKEGGTYLVPTLIVLNYIVEDGAKHGVPAENIAKGRSVMAERDARLRKAVAAGVKVAFGSDLIFEQEQAVREFALLVKLGLTPQQAIRAATINAAELLGLDKELGSIEVGKRADLVAVTENPLDNIRTLEAVKFVMKDGRVVKQELPDKQAQVIK
jgi:imidazolonepropionase-like amidohydrolase